jgi:hypothetical protein
METVADKSDGARLIKVADKIANLRDLAEHPPHWDAERMQAYRDFSADVIRCAGACNRCSMPWRRVRWPDAMQHDRHVPGTTPTSRKELATPTHEQWKALPEPAES